MRVNPTRRQHAQLLNEVILPISVYSHRHEIIHNIVLVSDRVEHLIDQGLLLRGSHIDKTEVVVLVSAEGTRREEAFV